MTHARNQTSSRPPATGRGAGSVLLAVALLAVGCTSSRGRAGSPTTETSPSTAPATIDGAAQAPPAGRGLPGLIAYSTEAGDIWVMRADGSGRPVTHVGGHDLDPSLSPDGRRLAFGSERGGSFDVWVVNADGGGQRRLTSGADQESPAAWLPDGRIVYASFHDDQPLPRWFLMNTDGTGIHSLPQLQGAADPIDWLVTAG
jgi:dipeptidyl aminopeptidase/acylaminoacyl peptidase